MADRGIRRLLAIARRNVSKEITNLSENGNRYSRGLAGEGYYGGYRDALDDVGIALGGGLPDRKPWWTEEATNG